VILAARRAKQIINGSKKRVELRTDHPLTVAFEEFRQGRVTFDILMEEEKNQSLPEEEIEESSEPIFPLVAKPVIGASDEDEDEDEEEEDEEEPDEDEDE